MGNFSRILILLLILLLVRTAANGTLEKVWDGIRMGATGKLKYNDTTNAGTPIYDVG